jgi:hypothetical protein
MIVVEIGSQKYMLAKVQDAETLLRILTTATPLEESYELPWNERLFEAKTARPVDISIVFGAPLGYEEAQKRIAEAKANKTVEEVSHV